MCCASLPRLFMTPTILCPHPFPLTPPIRYQIWWPSSERLQDKRKKQREEEHQGQEEGSDHRRCWETTMQIQGGRDGGMSLTLQNEPAREKNPYTYNHMMCSMISRCTTKSWRVSLATLKTGCTLSTCSEEKLGTPMSILWMMTGLLEDSRWG